jgi:cytochrome c
MKTITRLTLGLGLAVMCGTSLADSAVMEALAKKNNCLTCHAIDRKGVGPSFKEIATKYKEDKSAEGRLVEKLKKGSTGVWGSMPMPPNPKLKTEDSNALVQWILSM